MLLALDIGNTQTVIGLFGPASAAASGASAGLLHTFRVSTVGSRTSDELAVVVADFFRLGGIGLAGNAAGNAGVLEGAVVSSSVPTLVGAVREMVGRLFGVPLVVVGPGIRTGMPIRYDSPKDVGPDRVVNAVAALDLYGCPAIVVDLGTATTFDVISADGDYLGGAIVPGIEISTDALFEKAAALRRVELAAPARTIGRTTVESVQAGAVFGHAALVDGLCQRIEAELGAEATVVATGGLGALVAPHCRTVGHYEPWLTLHGLRLLYERNAEAGVAETAVGS